MLEIIQSGCLTTIQDLGRIGQRHLGVSQTGALDPIALHCANLLLANPAHSAGLEISCGPVQIRFLQAHRFALMGADYRASLAGTAVSSGFAYQAHAGQTLILQRPQSGMRTYLAIGGGLSVKTLFGSHSTDLNNGFGGYLGRQLQRGDRLEVLASDKPMLAQRGIRPLNPHRPIRVITGPEWSWFSSESQRQLLQCRWRVGAESNRMGYRLQGSKLQLNQPLELLSQGTLPGVIQVPPSGQPIVLLADAQTLGGYPRIACVIHADLWRFAQYPARTEIAFELVTLEQAQQARLQQQAWLQQLERLTHATLKIADKR